MSTIKIGHALVYRNQAKAGTLGDLSRKQGRRERRSTATIGAAYAKGYKRGLAGDNGLTHCTYKDQDKVDAYKRGLEDARTTKLLEGPEAELGRRGQ